MAETITVLSLKGGTGKTTTVRTLADVYRRIGLDVLCVDLDPQGNLSDYFDVPPDATPTIADVLVGRAEAKDAIHGDVMPADLTLAEEQAPAVRNTRAEPICPYERAQRVELERQRRGSTTCSEW